MSLESKLTGISKEYKEKKLENKKAIENKKLTPIRQKIKDLERRKNEMELVFNSLKLKTSKKTGGGMHEYKTSIQENLEQRSQKLDNLVEKHQEALKDRGIDNKEQLLENQDFNKEKEIVEYQKAKKSSEGLKISDAELQNKLKDFDVDINSQEFSYDMIESKLEDKIRLLNEEIYREKLKIPNNKEEVIKNLAKRIEDSIYSTTFEEEGFNKYIFKIEEKDDGYHNPNFEIKIWDDNVQVGDRIFNLVSKEIFSELEEKYGLENATLVFKSFYKDKVDGVLDRFKDKGNNKIESQKLEMVKKQILTPINNYLDFYIKREELINTAKDIKFGNINFDYNRGLVGLVEDIESYIRKIKDNKSDANFILSRIKDIKDKLIENEDIILYSNFIEIPSVVKERKELLEDIDLKVKRLKELENEIYSVLIKEPKLFGKKKWKENLDNLKENKQKLIEEISKLKKKDNELMNKSYFYFLLDKLNFYSDVKKEMKNQKKIRGKAEEVFSKLEGKLQIFLNTEVPELILKLDRDFNKLKEISSKRYYKREF